MLAVHSMLADHAEYLDFDGLSVLEIGSKGFQEFEPENDQPEAVGLDDSFDIRHVGEFSFEVWDSSGFVAHCESLAEAQDIVNAHVRDWVWLLGEVA